MHGNIVRVVPRTHMEPFNLGGVRVFLAKLVTPTSACAAE
jgi:hypothetical protein